SDGVYVEGTVEGIKIIFTADTGSSITIVSERTYNKIPEQYKPKLVPSSTVANANGIPLQELGRAMFDLTIGDLSIYKELLVAKIEDEGLLGVDILQNRKGGAADILLSQGLIRLHGVDIPCVQIGIPENNACTEAETRPDGVRKVRVIEDTTVPATSEMIVDVMIDRKECDDEEIVDFLIESEDSLASRYGITMAATTRAGTRYVDLQYRCQTYLKFCT
ncbi:hypothetical protein FSP39_005425, partial [Pinctada imbricata]